MWQQLAPNLLVLYNACLVHGVFPHAWKLGQIKVLLKNGKKHRTDARSYRPICLLPVLGKIYERLILQLLTHTLETYSSPQQYVFRQERSITALYDKVAGKPQRLIMGLFVDFEGAFDNLW